MPAYDDLLRTAVEAALAAGDTLRRDFLRSEGPEGSGEHAVADEPAEQLIRRRLLSATPDWSFLGEETGHATIPDAEHVWIVDPNDGTAAYLEGYRGSAVSIGLVRGGVPVLGVTYAFVAPDNEGDLFAWAEGCGPLRRNGVPVEREVWQNNLATDSVVLVNRRADRAAAAYLSLIAPARYWPATSIAYRLALTAAGEAAAAVELEGPVSWDFAAGHALLRGAGGDLVDERGETVHYAANGDATTRHCFGGSPTVVRRLASLSWQQAREAARSFREEPYDLCRPLRGAAVSDTGLLRRAQGSWLGQLTGDALGSMVEFRSGDELRRTYPDGLRRIGSSPVHHTIAGQPTDDSEMALLIARTLLRDGRFDDEQIAHAHAFWLDSGPFDVGSTIGHATSVMLAAKRRGDPVAASGRAAANVQSEANGALMRQSPLALWGHSLAPDELDRMARADAALTHPNPVCADASAAFIVALAATVREGLSGEEAYDRAVRWDAEHGSSRPVTDALAAARHSRPAYTRNMGHVIIALQNAFYQALHAPSFEEGVVDTVMGGGDTDTNAAITGALLGAIHGAPAVPLQWRTAVLSCHPQRGAAGVRQPRPRAFWPSDALYLAERLLNPHAGVRPEAL